MATSLNEGNAATDSRQAKSTAGILATETVTLAITIIVSIVIARELGAVDRGKYAFLLLLGGTLLPLMFFGFGVSVSYFVANRSFEVRRIAATCVVVGVLVGMVAALGIAALWETGLFGKTSAEIDQTLVLSVLALLPLQGGRIMLGRLLIADSRFGVNNLWMLVQRVLLAATLFLTVVIFGLGLPGCVIAMVVTTVVTSLGLAGEVWRRYRPVLRIDSEFVAQGAAHGIKAWAGALAQHANLRFDQLILGMLCEPAALGNYTIATMIAELCWLPVRSVGPVLFNRVAAFRSEAERSTSTERIHRIMVISSSLLAVLLIAVTFLIVPWLLGDGYEQVGPLTTILLSGVGASVSFRVLCKFFGGIGRPFLNSVAHLVAFVVGTGLSIALTTQFGVYGAAVACAFTYAIGAAVLVFLYLRRVSPRRPQLLWIRRSDVRWLRDQFRGIFASPGGSPAKQTSATPG